jgi:hypothetical protein
MGHKTTKSTDRPRVGFSPLYSELCMYDIRRWYEVVLKYYSQTGRLTDSVWGQGEGDHAPTPQTDKLTNSE